MFYDFPIAEFILPSGRCLSRRIKSLPLASALFRAAASGNLREPAANLRGPTPNIDIFKPFHLPSPRAAQRFAELRGGAGLPSNSTATPRHSPGNTGTWRSLRRVPSKPKPACSRFNSFERLSARHALALEPVCPRPTSSCSRRRGLPRTPHRPRRRRRRPAPWHRRTDRPPLRRPPDHRPPHRVSWKRGRGPRSWR